MITILVQRWKDILPLICLCMLYGACAEPSLSPTLDDHAASNITITRATLGGELTDDKGVTIDERGIVYARTSDNDLPLFGGEGVTSRPAQGTSEGVFNVDVSGLEADTEYSYTAYARTSTGTYGYSATSTFTTLSVKIENPAVSGYDGSRVTLGGDLTDDGGGAVTERGVVYSQLADNPQPEIGGTGVTQASAAGTGTGSFTVDVSGLAAQAVYVFRAYARVGTDTVYTEAVTFPDGEVPLPGTGAGQIYGLVPQADGKTLVYGQFENLGGTTLYNLARLNQDGSLDLSFAPNPRYYAPHHPGQGWVNSVAVQRDGKIVIGGYFTELHGQPTYPSLARLNPDGSEDQTFQGKVDYGYVESIAIQSDDRILVGGYLLNLNDNPRYASLGRLNQDGTLDTTFSPGPPVANPNALVDDSVRTVQVQQDGRILIGGFFTKYDGEPRYGFARLNSNGSLDPGFDPGFIPDAFTQQADGKVLVAGYLNGVSGLTRLDSTGGIDITFATASPYPNIIEIDNYTTSVLTQTDGKILVGGYFSTVNGTVRNGIARFDADGTLEPFAPDFGFPVTSLALSDNGDLFVGGDDLDGPASPQRKLIRRYRNDTPSTRTLGTAAPKTVHWSRNGSGPEIFSTRFELSVDRGTTWSPLGPATRMAGGWELTASTLPSSGLLRAQGRAYGSANGSSSYLVEQVESFPIAGLAPPIVDSPTRTNLSAREVTLGGTVSSEGAGPVTSRGVVLARFIDNSRPAIGGSRVIQIPTPGTTGSFTVEVSDLVPDTVYAYRAYAANPVGTGYSTLATFRTPGPPRIDSPTVDNVDGNGVTLGANVAADGGSSVTARGIAYQAVPRSYVQERLPNKESFTKIPASSGGTGAFTVTVTGLIPDTDYVFVGYATNEFGTAYTSLPVEFTTAAFIPLVDAASEDGPGRSASNRNLLAGVGSSGNLDGSFDIGLDSGEYVQAIAVQADGKTILAGNFQNFDGEPRSHLARIDDDGIVDNTFIGTLPGLVYSLAVQPNGKIILGGLFTEVNGSLRNGIARLESDGTTESPTTFSVGAGADSLVYGVAVQPDDKILAVGLFEQMQGESYNRIARLEANGALDTSFDPGSGADDAIHSLALQPDGKILITGTFLHYGGTPTGRIARLHPNGSLDPTFDPGSGANGRITALALQPDGKILVGGAFQSFDGTPAGRIARLDPDGSRDTTFSPGTGADDEVLTIALQADGKILIGGRFQEFGGNTCNRITRLHPDGSIDTTYGFGGGADDEISAIALQEDGGILVGGLFETIDGVPQTGFARFKNDIATHTLIAPNRGTLHWLRGGGGPEISPPGFEISTNGGTSWISLGTGTRIPGGWALSGISLPTSGLARVHAATQGGFLSGSSGLVEDTAFFRLAGPGNSKTVIAALRAQMVALQSEISGVQSKMKKAKKKKNKKLVKKLNKSLKSLQARLAGVSAELATY